MAVGDSEQVVIGEVSTWSEGSAEVVALSSTVVHGSLVGLFVDAIKAGGAVAIGVNSSLGGCCGHLVTVSVDDFRHVVDAIL